MAFPTTIAPGFNYDEALTLLEIAQSTYAGPKNQPPPSDCTVAVPPPPDEWQLMSDKTPSDTTLLDNFWQVWNRKNTRQYVIAVRGTVETGPSILEDTLLPLIKAHWDLKIDVEGFKIDFPFHLARDEGDSPVVAGVHAGFALGMLLMLFTTNAPLFTTLMSFGRDDEVYITGHSQGASVALLITSLVRHSKWFFQGPAYKTYVYAPAKPGNDHYAYDLDQIASAEGFCYSIVNSQDWVPQVPLTLQGIQDINRPNPLFQFDGKLESDIPAEIQKIIGDIDKAAKNLFDDIEDRIKKRLQDLEQDLHLAAYPVPAKRLTDDSDAPAANVNQSSISGILDQVFDALLPSLNFAKAGALVPVFGEPGGNPDDPTDSFWQHHLCNYIRYLKQDYGPGS